MTAPKSNPTIYTGALVLLLGFVLLCAHLQATAAQGDVEASIKIPVVGISIAPGLIMTGPSVQGIEIQVTGSAEHMQALQEELQRAAEEAAQSDQETRQMTQEELEALRRAVELDRRKTDATCQLRAKYRPPETKKDARTSSSTVLSPSAKASVGAPVDHAAEMAVGNSTRSVIGTDSL